MRRIVALLAVAVLLAGAGSPVQNQVRQVYDGCGTLCYLGALAMALPDEVPYRQIVRYTNPANFPNGEMILGKGLQNLGYQVAVRGVDRARVDEFLKMMAPSASAEPGLADQAAAADALEALVRKRAAPMVPVMQAVLWEDRAAFLQKLGLPVPPNPGQGPHYLVVTGFDAGHFYVNDPAREGKGGVNVPIRRARFLQAWGEAGSVTMVPHKKAVPVAESQVLPQVMEAARAAVADLEALNQKLAAAAESPLELSDFLNLSAGAFRREALADWLAEKGHPDPAGIYRAVTHYYKRVRPDMTAREAQRVVERILELEKQAAGLLP